MAVECGAQFNQDLDRHESSVELHGWRRYRRAVVEGVCILDAIEIEKAALMKYTGMLTVRADDSGIMRDQDERAITALFEEFDMAPMTKPSIADRQAFIDEKAIEFDRHRQGESQAHCHTGRVVKNRLAKIDAEFGELLNKRHERPPLHAVDSADELQVVEPCEMRLKGTRERQRPTDAHAAVNASRTRQFRTAQQTDQRALSGPVAPENAKVSPAFETHGDMVEDSTGPMPGVVVLAHGLQFDHREPTLREASRSRNNPMMVSARFTVAM